MVTAGRFAAQLLPCANFTLIITYSAAQTHLNFMVALVAVQTPPVACAAGQKELKFMAARVLRGRRYMS